MKRRLKQHEQHPPGRMGQDILAGVGFYNQVHMEVLAREREGLTADRVETEYIQEIWVQQAAGCAALIGGTLGHGQRQAQSALGLRELGLPRGAAR